jgi:hypothetical protein
MDRANGVRLCGVVGKPLGTKRDAELDLTPGVSRVSGCDDSEGLGAARDAESPKEIQSSDKSEHSIVPIGYLI